MLLAKVSDEQYLKYSRRLQQEIFKAESYGQLVKCLPSLVMVQMQATDSHRTFQALALAQDYEHRLYTLTHRKDQWCLKFNI